MTYAHLNHRLVAATAARGPSKAHRFTLSRALASGLLMTGLYAGVASAQTAEESAATETPGPAGSPSPEGSPGPEVAARAAPELPEAVATRPSPDDQEEQQDPEDLQDQEDPEPNGPAASPPQERAQRPVLVAGYGPPSAMPFETLDARTQMELRASASPRNHAGLGLTIGGGAATLVGAVTLLFQPQEDMQAFLWFGGVAFAVGTTALLTGLYLLLREEPGRAALEALREPGVVRF